jgi:hypothetical protein
MIFPLSRDSSGFLYCVQPAMPQVSQSSAAETTNHHERHGCLRFLYAPSFGNADDRLQRGLEGLPPAAIV